jgi:hypothetical protein
LPAITGLVPDRMVRAIAAFLDFCYLVRLPSFSESDLAAIDDALARYKKEREIFVETGVCPKGISLPRQHALQHYRRLIEQFGAPHGLSTSITESMHIDAVKEPWRRSNKYEALGQMLIINQRLDKMAALRASLVAQGQLDKPLVPEGVELVMMDASATREGEEGSIEPSEKFEAIVEAQDQLNEPLVPEGVELAMVNASTTSREPEEGIEPSERFEVIVELARSAGKQ